MGTNTLTAVSAGVSSEDDLNQFRDALIGDIVPRDNSGIPADAAGNLGAPTIQFDKLFCKRLFQSGIEIAGDPEKIQPNDVIDGATRSGSNQPQYLEPSGSGAGFTVIGTATTLQVDINSSLVEVSADVSGTSTLAPSSNNTCLVNDSAAASQYSTRTWGEYLAEKESITIDTAGSEITNRVGQFAAFKVGTTEYFMAYIASSTSLQFAYRGFFYDTSGNPLNRLTLADNATITLMALNWVFLKNDGTVSVTTRTPTWSATEPSSPSSNDRWYDLTIQEWKKYNGSAFVSSDETWIGWVVSDSTNCVAARCREFAANYKEDNTIVLGNLANATVDSLRANSIINVCGEEIAFNLTFPQWNMASHLASSADLYSSSEQASRVYYFFVSDIGELKISDVHPYWRPDLKGYYAPHQPWRCVGFAHNNGSSNFDYHSWFPGSYHDREKTFEQQGTVASNSFTTTWETYCTTNPTFRKRGTYLITIEHSCESSDASTKTVQHRLQNTTKGTTVASWTDVIIQGGSTLRSFLSLPKEVTISNLDDTYELQVQTASGTATSEMRGYTSEFRDVLFMGA